MKVLIIGAGIGGLTAALCCLQFGHEVQIFEQSAQLSALGAGIQIPPNAFKVLQKLGLEAQIAEHGFYPQALEARLGRSGRSIFSLPLQDHALSHWGAPYLHIHRADYIKVLLEALKSRLPDRQFSDRSDSHNNALYLGAQVKDFTQSENVIRLHLEDGRHFDGDIVIAADGIKSQMQQRIMAKAERRLSAPQFTGNLAWRLVLPVQALSDIRPNPTACVWMGPARHAVSYYLRGGALINFVGVIEQEYWDKNISADQDYRTAQDDRTAMESWTRKGDKADLLQDFSGWHPIIKTLIKASDEAALYQWALFDRQPLPVWSYGRAALLGDAVHPMLPFMAQGAAMAVEDSWVLAQAISDKTRPASQSLLAYQQARQDRTARVQAISRRNSTIFHQKSLLGQGLYYGPMWGAGRMSKRLIYRRFDWLYGHDVTQNLI